MQLVKLADYFAPSGDSPRAGLVTAQRRGQEIHYELNTSVFEDLVQHLMDWAKPTSGKRTRERAAQRKTQEA